MKKKDKFRIKSFNSKRELRRWVPGIQKVCNQSFSESFEEENIKSMGDMKAIGVRRYKKHRVYEQVFGS